MPTQPAPPADRAIRVFISSTFRDMHEEREVLVKRVFPALRDLCDKRGVTLTEVDLRWGVTDEQKAEGRVLPIILEEIERCRPYFIGILGERYGWTPDEPHPEIEARPKSSLWQRILKSPHPESEPGRSVTELEIARGVLQNPAMAKHAFFYFRAPSYLDRLPPGKRADYSADNPDAARKLERLKKEIRASGLPVRDGYPDPTALGELVLRDLTEVINQAFPEGEQSGPLEREAAGHDAFARERTAVYVANREYFDALDKYVTQGNGGAFFVTGEPGMGKSALLANWADRVRKARPSACVLTHFVEATSEGADWAAMLRRILSELKRRFNLDLEIPTSPDDLRSSLGYWLRTANFPGGLFLVLDGLDHLEDAGGALDLEWLPAVFPNRVRVIVSTSPGRPLDALRKRGWPSLEIQPLSVAQRLALVDAYLAQYAKTLDRIHSHRIAQAEPSSSPLFLTTVLEELRLFGSHEQLTRRIEDYLGADTVTNLYRRVLDRWEQDYEPDRAGLVRDSLRLLRAARSGLAESEILDLLGTAGEPLPRAIWSPLLLAARRALRERHGILVLSEPCLREAVRQKYIETAEVEDAAHLRLADYFSGREISPRTVEELPWQLSAARQWPRLVAYLGDPLNLHFTLLARKSDPFSFWTRIEENSSFRVVDTYRDLLASATPAGARALLPYVAELLHSRGHFREEIDALGALISADPDAAPRERTPLLLMLGQALWSAGELDRALATAREAEALAMRLDDKVGLRRALGIEGMVLLKQGKPAEALACHQERARLCRESGDWAALQDCLDSLTAVSQTLADMPAALAYNLESMQLARESGWLRGYQAATGNRANLLMNLGQFDEALKLFEEQEAVARQIGYKDGIQRALGSRAQILSMRGRSDEALALHQSRAIMCREMGHADGLWRALEGQAAIFGERGEFDRAWAAANEQEDICRKGGYPNGLQRALGMKALILSRTKRPEPALELALEQERICRASGGPETLAAALMVQARVRGDGLGQHQEALACAQEALRIATDHGIGRRQREAQMLVDHCLSALHPEQRSASASLDPENADALDHLAEVLFEQGKYAEALEALQKEERLLSASGEMRRLSPVLGHQTIVLKQMGDVEELARILPRLKALGDVAEYCDALTKLGCAHADRGEFVEALAVFEEQVAIWRELGNQAGLQQSLQNQAAALIKLGRQEEALECAREQRDICQESENKDGLAAALSNRAGILAEQGQYDEAMAEYKKAEDLARETGNPYGIALCLMNRARLLDHVYGRDHEALEALKEAYGLAMTNGLTDLAQKAQPLIEDLLRRTRRAGT
ncbi:MAG TPA: tetratricopeptide repeat protein [Bryobacteraceae bacterium]|nr:tetratricopeptide repeat protein [Bryobacteraceae bacterium]